MKLSDDTGAPEPAALIMQQNLYRFSGAKSYAQMVEINNLLTKKGKQRGFDEFKADVLKINEKYNQNYLQAEWQTANQSAKHARDWQEYQRNKKNFPNLKYKTQGDDKVRPEHEELEGIIAPIDSDFWSRYYPPNGWRCRCYVVQTAEPATKNIPTDVESIAPEFRNNVGIGGEVFKETPEKGSKQHPYFVLARSSGGKQLEIAFERMKAQAPSEIAYKAKKGGKVAINPFADISDLEDNFNTGRIIADGLNANVLIRPHLNRNLIKGKNPEYEINGRLADRKGIQSLKGISSAIDASKRQMMDKDTNPDGEAYTIVIDLSGIKTIDLKELRTNLSRKITPDRGKHIYSIIFTRDKIAVELLRDEIVRRDYKKLDKIQ